MAAANDRCPKCDVRPDEFHVRGCMVEQCPYCGRRVLACRCNPKAPPDDRLPWTGLCPGVAECRELGWYVRLVPGKGRVRCGADEPGATEDLSRLRAEARWDRGRHKFVRRR